MTNRIGKTPRRVRIRKKRLDGVQTRRELRLAGCCAFGVSYLIVSGCLCAHYISASHLLPPELKFVRKLSQTPGVTGEDHLPGERVTHMVINPTATTKEERKKTKNNNLKMRVSRLPGVDCFCFLAESCCFFSFILQPPEAFSKF